MNLLEKMSNNIEQKKRLYSIINKDKQNIVYELCSIQKKKDNSEQKKNYLKIKASNYKFVDDKQYLIILNNLQYYTNDYDKLTIKYNLKLKKLKECLKEMEYYINEINVDDEKLKKLKKKEEYYNKNFIYVNLFRRGI
jgi:hypothetical protein